MSFEGYIWTVVCDSCGAALMTQDMEHPVMVNDRAWLRDMAQRQHWYVNDKEFMCQACQAEQGFV